MNDVSAMLRHLADQIDQESVTENAAMGAAVLVLNRKGEWAGMLSSTLGPFAAVSLLEHSKIDLACGGNRWSEFTPTSANPPAANH